MIERACLPYIVTQWNLTDDSRFNSCEKHMLTDSVQPYNKPIIDLACSVCTVKYQTSVFCMDLLLLRRSVPTKGPVIIYGKGGGGEFFLSYLNF
jgi:hypothetical protein